MAVRSSVCADTRHQACRSVFAAVAYRISAGCRVPGAGCGWPASKPRSSPRAQVSHGLVQAAAKPAADLCWVRLGGGFLGHSRWCENWSRSEYCASCAPWRTGSTSSPVSNIHLPLYSFYVCFVVYALCWHAAPQQGTGGRGAAVDWRGAGRTVAGRPVRGRAEGRYRAVQADQQAGARLGEEDPGAWHQLPADGEHPALPGGDQEVRCAGGRDLPNRRPVRAPQHPPGDALPVLARPHDPEAPGVPGTNARTEDGGQERAHLLGGAAAGPPRRAEPADGLQQGRIAGRLRFVWQLAPHVNRHTARAA